ncbi:MAG: DUF2600 family protein [Solirubrobacterales bacterium]
MEESCGDRAGRRSLVGPFAWAAVRYWFAVCPRVRSEMRHWRRSASRIADPTLRRLALVALAKDRRMEGAAAFATFVPWRVRGSAVRALVAFQAIYNYLDILAQQPSDDPAGNAPALHRALLLALDPSGESSATDARPAVARADGDYLAEMIAACETASWQLPSYGAVAATLRGAAERIVAFQSVRFGRQGELESWAERQGPTSAGFRWGEVVAAAGSTLVVHALIAAAGSPDLSAQEVAAIDAAYFPCIGALQSLLGGLVARQEGAVVGQLHPPVRYLSSRRAEDDLERLAVGAFSAARDLPHGSDHVLLVATMTCSHLVSLEPSASHVEGVTRRVRASLGSIARLMLLSARLRRLARARPRSAPSPAAGGGEHTAPAMSVRVEAGGGDARSA